MASTFLYLCPSCTVCMGVGSPHPALPLLGPQELGDVKYLLSPQDLMAVELVPELIQAGVSCFKIEGECRSRGRQQGRPRIIACLLLAAPTPFFHMSQSPTCLKGSEYVTPT